MPITAYGIQKWDMVKIAVLIFFRGEFLSLLVSAMLWPLRGFPSLLVKTWLRPPVPTKARA